MLEVRNLTVRYGGLTALSGVSLNIEQGAFVALLGANGAGKSSLFKAICGTVDIAGGEILYRGSSITRLRTHARARLGIAHVPEGRHVFKAMTVAENLEVGMFASRDSGKRAEVLGMIYALFPKLAERQGQLAGTLSGGEQQMVAIARGLASHPSMLLLDEPSMGLGPAIADEIFERVRELHEKRGLTVLLVEQRVVEALDMCDSAHVLQNGRVVVSGPPELLRNDERVRSAYVGS